jgi:hypothetical protein
MTFPFGFPNAAKLAAEAHVGRPGILSALETTELLKYGTPQKPSASGQPAAQSTSQRDGSSGSILPPKPPVEKDSDNTQKPTPKSFSCTDLIAS